ncbi:MAG: trigger factor [Parvularculales bacterium]
MQVTETESDGLKRAFKIVVESADLSGRLDKRLEEAKSQVNLKGFRPGKVPVGHLRKVFGRQFMSEIVQQVIGETSVQALEERSLRPVQRPHIHIEGDAEAVMAGEADLAYSMEFEFRPDIEIMDLSTLAVERETVAVTEEAIDEAVGRLAANQKNYGDAPEKTKAEEGHRLTVDFVGRINGESFEGGTAEDAHLELGSGQFIPGFENQLIGSSVGDTPEVTVTFPDDYPAEHLKGKTAVFEVTVKGVAVPQEVVVNDEFAKNFGMESLARLRDEMGKQIARDYETLARSKVKRLLLDEIDQHYSFDLPPSLVSHEFDQLWKQVQAQNQAQAQEVQGGEEASEAPEPEKQDQENAEDDALKAEYQGMAERRVRLGLVLAEIGEKNNIDVEEGEIQQALANHVRQFPGQEQKVFDLYKERPDLMDQIRMPLFEEKVVDFILERVQVTDRQVTPEELRRDPDEEGGASSRVTGKTAKKASAKKTAAKKKTGAKKTAAKKKATAKKTSK